MKERLLIEINNRILYYEIRLKKINNNFERDSANVCVGMIKGLKESKKTIERVFENDSN